MTSSSTAASPNTKPNRPVALQRFILLFIVFLSGMTSLAVELSASRLLAPYFGSSLFIWAILIGMELVYLTIGYYVGGRLADRRPTSTRLYSIVALAATLIGLVPILSRPILTVSLQGFASLDVGAFIGSLVGTVLLFALPVTLLGMVTPFAIRLEITKLDEAGNTAGLIYALSTIGSILGTFLPVFVLIPTIGTESTFLAFAAILLVGSLAGLWVAGARPRFARLGGPLMVLVVGSLVLNAIPHTIKPAYEGQLIAERESLYNYIQVDKYNGQYELVLNEGQAVHSIYYPGHVLTNGIWDLFTIAPFFNNPPYTTADLHNAAVIGLGAGTVPYILTNTYGPIPIDGVEIDPEIVKLGRQYFAMTEPNLKVHIEDGRYYLDQVATHYDLIAIDAYQQPYIPFQLTTREFFQIVRNHLTPHGVVAINAGRTTTDYRLVNALTSTLRAVFKRVYVIDALRDTNSMIIATNDDTTQIGNLAANGQILTQPDLRQVVAAAQDHAANLRVGQPSSIVFTDDHAPVETLINQIILGYIRNGSGNP